MHDAARFRANADEWDALADSVERRMKKKDVEPGGSAEDHSSS
jgi:hypothetical protein